MVLELSEPASIRKNVETERRSGFALTSVDSVAMAKHDRKHPGFSSHFIDPLLCYVNINVAQSELSGSVFLRN